MHTKKPNFCHHFCCLVQEKAICRENATNGRSASRWNLWIWLLGTIMIGKADTIPKPRPAQSYPPSQSGFAFKFENGLVHAATPSPNVKFNWVPCRHWMGDGIGLCRLFGGEISACFLCPQEGRKGEPTNQPTNLLALIEKLFKRDGELEILVLSFRSLHFAFCCPVV